MMPRAGLNFVLATLLTMAVATPCAVAREVTFRNPNPDRTWGSKVGSFLASGKSIAVVIGISNYLGERAGGYPALPTASRDADKMFDFLIKDAGFDIVYVLTDNDATKQKIDQLMTDVVPEVVRSGDRFLFYWSGHGDQRRPRGDGSAFGFLPLANSKRNEFSAMVSMDDISRWDRYLSAQHSLFILDACLSGLAGAEKKSPRDSRLEQLSLPAHHLLTAGTANETVISGERWTGSLFTDSFILGARGQARGSSGIVSLFSLIDFIQDRVVIEKQAANWSKSLTPQLRSLQAGDGAFFFTSMRQLTGPISPGGVNPNANNESKGTDVVVSPRVVVPPSPVDWSAVSIKTTDLGNRTYMLEGQGGNITVAVGTDAIIMVDTQFAPLSDKIKAAIKAISPLPIKYVVNTHFHGDHTGGNANFQKDGATVIAQDNIRVRLVAGTTNGTTGNKTAPVASDALPKETYIGGSKTIQVGGRKAVLTHANNAHTDGDTWVYFPDANVLCTGDIMNSLHRYQQVDFANGGDIRGMISATEAWLRLANDKTKVVVGHGPLAKKADIATYNAMVKTARERVERLFNEGKSEAEVVALKPLADLDATWAANEQAALNFLKQVYNSFNQR
jgi:cyclase